MAHVPKKVLAVVTRMDVKGKQACERLREFGLRHRWEVFSAECYRGTDGNVVVERSPILVDGSLPALVDHLAPNGVFICGTLDYFDDSRKLSRLGVPIVSKAGEQTRSRSARVGARGFVMADEESIAACAAEVLLSLGFGDYGYVPFFSDAGWSRTRGELFGRRIAAAGKSFHVFGPRAATARSPDRAESLARWLKGLPKPCGILAANDIEGEEVLRVCARCGFRVPNDIAVVGVDNRAEICESTSPTLSSVDPGVQTQYAEAMALLAKLMADGARGQVLRRLPARGVVERASTRLLSDGRVDRAREFIRVHACEEGFAVGDVARSMCVCRTLADRLFRKVAGTTILREIHAVRIERAKELLAAGQKPDLVAAECGYASADDFRRVFRQHTSMTPRKWALAPH